MKNEELTELWSDPSNWRWWGYSCKRDPRIFVPERKPWIGWAMNRAHPEAFVAMLALITIGVVPIFLFLYVSDYRPDFYELLGVLGVVISVMYFLCHFISRLRKF